MTWFKLGSIVSEDKYELLGLFASLAIYNGVTIPFNFPKIVYHKLLGLPIDLDDLHDGWPEQTENLGKLRDHFGDVEEVYAYEYVFSADVVGILIYESIWKRACPDLSFLKQFGNEGGGLSYRDPLNDIGTSTNSHAIGSNIVQGTISTNRMVTNDNREQFISDYINALVNTSIASQYDHFRRGFFRCIAPKSISLFTPNQLKHLLEGSPYIDIRRLKDFTKYESGYHPNHPVIKTFWDIVSAWPQDKIGKLLEFVTANDRLPIGGEARVQFTILRNGEGNERLPTSLTCFGRLLLPEYEGREKMEWALKTVRMNQTSSPPGQTISGYRLLLLDQISKISLKTCVSWYANAGDT